MGKWTSLLLAPRCPSPAQTCPRVVYARRPGDPPATARWCSARATEIPTVPQPPPEPPTVPPTRLDSPRCRGTTRVCFVPLALTAFSFARPLRRLDAKAASLDLRFKLQDVNEEILFSNSGRECDIHILKIKKKNRCVEA